MSTSTMSTQENIPEVEAIRRSYPVLLRHARAVEMLEQLGASEYLLKKWNKAGLAQPVRPAGATWRFYRRDTLLHLVSGSHRQNG